MFTYQEAEFDVSIIKRQHSSLINSFHLFKGLFDIQDILGAGLILPIQVHLPGCQQAIL